MSTFNLNFSPPEKKAVFSIAGIFALRMIGLFMLVPILAPYLQSLKGSTPLTIGITLGCYGLTQALFQLPLGFLSDRLGRKPIVAGGLIVFLIGSLIAAFSSHIFGIILGRSLQGVGAVGSAANAWLADQTSDENRTMGMAVVGITIALSFTIAMMLGPLLNTVLNIPEIFGLTAGFALLALWILTSMSTEASFENKHETTQQFSYQEFKKLFTYSKLWNLNLGIFFLHSIFTANFIAIPLLLSKIGSIQASWHFYLPALLIALLIAFPTIRKIEKRSFALPASIALLGISELFMIFFQTPIIFTLILSLFFTAFTLLEALLPAKVSKIVPPHLRGSAMGLFSSCQFLGIFVGGTLGGWLYGKWLNTGIFVAALVIALFWFMFLKIKLLWLK